MICNLGNTIAAFKERALIGFYFYNCFDTDRKNDILSVMVILFFITGVKNEKQKEGHQESCFVCCNILFSLYCCSLEDREHFPTNAIKSLILNMFLFCFLFSFS